LVRTNTHPVGENRRKDCLAGRIIDVSLRDYLSWSKTQKHIHKLFRAPVAEFSNSTDDLPIDPYFLGVLLGDGCLLGRARVTTPDPEIVNCLYEQAAVLGLDIRIGPKRGTATTYCFRGAERGKNRLLPLLRDKTSSVANRLEILAGILDTDGYLSRSTCYDFISKSSQLAEDVAFIARSVGLSVILTPCHKEDQNGHGGTYYRLCISGDVAVIPCRVERRKAALRRQKKDPLRTGFSVHEVGTRPYYGFTLDGDGRYLLSDFTVTHNSGKSAVVSALANHGRTVIITKPSSSPRPNRFSNNTPPSTAHSP